MDSSWLGHRGVIGYCRRSEHSPRTRSEKYPHPCPPWDPGQRGNHSTATSQVRDSGSTRRKAGDNACARSAERGAAHRPDHRRFLQTEWAEPPDILQPPRRRRRPGHHESRGCYKDHLQVGKGLASPHGDRRAT